MRSHEHQLSVLQNDLSDQQLLKAPPLPSHTGSSSLIGWSADHEDVPLIRHDVTDWEPIESQAAARVSL
jgi:hypothetical protein